MKKKIDKRLNKTRDKEQFNKVNKSAVQKTSVKLN